MLSTMLDSMRRPEIPLQVIHPDDTRASIQRARQNLHAAADEIAWQVEREGWVTLGHRSWGAMVAAEYGDAAFMVPVKNRPELTNRSVARTRSPQARRIVSRVGVPDWPVALPSASKAKIKREDGTLRARIKRLLGDTASSLEGDDSSPDARQLVGLARASALIDELIGETVADLRSGEQPLSWTEIGTALGITRQAAQQRFGVKSD